MVNYYLICLKISWNVINQNLHIIIRDIKVEDLTFKSFERERDRERNRDIERKRERERNSEKRSSIIYKLKPWPLE